MKVINWLDLTPEQKIKALQRPESSQSQELKEGVKAIIDAVKQSGDSALFDFTKRFDKVDIQNLKVTEEELSEAETKISTAASEAIDQAIKNIECFHSQQNANLPTVETMPGVQCRRETRPIERVGLYVPGGTAPLPSTVMMLAIPARIAGCQTKVLCTPPRPDGTIEPHILVAAKRSGVDQIYKVGGAQAVAAMAFGTETVPKVYKIFGPGNSWVTEAKLQVALDPRGAMYDMPAGPSEVLVIADDQANPDFVASDLLSQAEHGVDSQSILVTSCPILAERVRDAVTNQLATLTRRSMAAKSIEKSAIIVCPSIAEAVAISNEYGPEHLIIQTKNAEAIVPEIMSAGSIFVGPWTPESVGDYASGTNHVLPTYGYTKATSGLGLESFTKQITIQSLSATGLQALGPTVMTLANVEGLDAHRQAVKLRLDAMKG